MSESTNGNQPRPAFRRGQMKLSNSRKTRRVPVPELECDFILKELSAGQIDTLNQYRDIAPQLCLMIVDEEGNQQFDPENPDDVKEIREMGFDLMLRLAREGTDLNGISPQATEQAIKNFEIAKSGASESA